MSQEPNTPLSAPIGFNSGEWYRVVFEQAADGILIVDGQGRLVEVNQRGCDMLGYTREALLSRSLADLIPSEDLIKEPLALNDLHTGQILLNERRLLCQDGRYLPVEVNIRQLADGYSLGFIRDITRRRQAEIEIEKLAKFPNENPNPVMRIAHDGVMLYANPASAALQENWDCQVGQSLPGDWYEIVVWTLQSGQPREREITVGEHTYSLFFAPLVKFGYVNIYAYDITPLKQALTALSESEAQYRGLFEHMLEGVAYCKMIFENGEPQDFIYITVNDMFEELTGLKDVAGKRVSEVIPNIRESDLELLNIYARVSLTGKPEKFEFFLKSLDMWFAVSVFSPEKEYFVAVFDVITERKQVEADLRLTRFSMDNVADAVYWIDDQARIVDVNQTACRMMGYSYDELTQMTLADIDPDFAYAEWPHTWQRIKQSTSLVLERRHLTKDGELIPVEIAPNFLRFEGRELDCAVVRDITERKRIEEAQAVLEEQLHQARKMESIGQLAGGVAHDFNNQLTVIKMYSDLIQRKMSADDPLREKLAHIQQASQRAADLTEQLLAFSRKQMLAPTVVDLNELVTNLQKMLKPLIGEDIILSTELQPALWPVTVDRSQIEQVIMNLVVNARDAMPTGGLLAITTENVVLNQDYARQHLETPSGPCVLLTIADTGHGMDRATQERIFEPFFTTKQVGEGTGLGLATAHGIIRQSGGNILVYSEPDQGATFKIYLPASETDEVVQGAAVTQPAILEGQETILVVEDETGLREPVVATLQGLGYTVLEAEDGLAALSLVEQYAGRIDLLLTDVVMPQMSGRELAEVLQAQNPSLNVLFMSGYMDDAVFRHGLLKAEVEFLSKPFSLHDLAAKVRAVLDKPR